MLIRASLWSIAAIMIFMLVAACASTGHNFKQDRVTLLRPGETTLDDAIAILDAKPTSRVYQDDGSTIAIWQYVSVVYVATTENNLVSILFDAQGVMERVVNLINIDLPEAERKRLRVMSESTVRIR